MDIFSHAKMLSVVLNEKNIFLFDGIGAVLSLIFTALVLPLLSDSIGIPVGILRCLAVLPLVYAIYSFSCYHFPEKTKSWMLLTIIAANLFYCVVSAALMYGLESVTLWGRLVLMAEIGIVLAVVAIELRVHHRTY